MTRALLALCLALGCARPAPPVGPPLGTLTPAGSAQTPAGPGRPTTPIGPVAGPPPGRLPGQGGVLPGEGGVLPNGDDPRQGDNGPLESSTISRAAALLNAAAQTVIIVGAILLAVILPMRRRRAPSKPEPPRPGGA